MRARASIYKLTRPIVGLLPASAMTVHSFLWLHLLDNRDLNDITVDSYTNRGSGGFGDEAFNARGLWAWEEATFRECLSGCASVLVAGAGGGREMVALARMGLTVVGFDASPELVEAGVSNLRNADVKATMLYAPPGEVPAIPEAHDALVVGRGVYHHIIGRDGRIAFLKACRRQVKPGAPFILGDFVTRAEGSHGLSALALTSRIERGDTVGESFYHLFTRDEILSELAAAGFDRIDYRVTPIPGAHMAYAVARSAG